MIHRDISPDNILVMPDGATVLLDLGAARQGARRHDAGMTTILKPGFAPIRQYVEDSSMEQAAGRCLWSRAQSFISSEPAVRQPMTTSRIVRDSMPPLHEAAPAQVLACIADLGRPGALNQGRLIVSKSMAEFRARSAGSKQPRVVAQAAEVTSTATPLPPRSVSHDSAVGSASSSASCGASRRPGRKADLRGKGSNYPPSSGAAAVGSAGRGFAVLVAVGFGLCCAGPHQRG